MCVCVLAGILCKFGDEITEAIFSNQTLPIQNVTTSSTPQPKAVQLVSAVKQDPSPTPTPSNSFMNSVVCLNVPAAKKEVRALRESKQLQLCGATVWTHTAAGANRARYPCR
jgi:hypothetical protein